MPLNFEDLKYFWSIEVLGGKDFSWVKLFLRSRGWGAKNYLFWFRLSQFLYLRGRLCKSLAKRINDSLKFSYGVEIILGVDIGPGLKIDHPTGIVINSRCRIGRNFKIRQNTTIGVARGKHGLIVIGDNVDVGANSCILGGGITIGDNARIGAMSFVNKDIPPNCTFVTTKSYQISENKQWPEPGGRSGS